MTIQTGPQMERLNGGEGEVMAGSIVTDREKPGRYYTVESLRDLSLSGDSRIYVYYKTSAGNPGSSPLADLLLTSHSELQARAQFEDIAEKVAALSKARDVVAKTGECSESMEEAEQAIQDDPLEVVVRSGWITPNVIGGRVRAEFKILLCTGGPAVQIIGELNEHCEPESARIEHQDWGTPWTEYRLTADEQETLLEYCRQFYFGE